jgi:hypothetical protein
MMAVQLLLHDSAVVFPNVIPSILTWSWKEMPESVAGVLQFPTASAFDLFGLSLVPVGLLINVYRMFHFVKFHWVCNENRYIISLRGNFCAPRVASNFDSFEAVIQHA